MTPKIFISYNPGVEVEQSTALRLQTLSGLYNAKVFLPDRSGKSGFKENTKQRILDATVFIMFSTDALSKDVIDEVNYALANQKMVIVFYDVRKGKNLDTSKITNKNNFHEKMFNPEQTTPNELLDYVKTVLENSNSDKIISGAGKILLALLGVGLGLLLLKALTDDDDEE
jgi:hypothetical protein